MAEQGWKAVVGQGRRGCTRGESALERQEALLTTHLRLLFRVLELLFDWKMLPVCEVIAIRAKFARITSGRSLF